MFNFTTQTIFNSIVKTTENAVREKTAPKGYNLILKDDANGPELRIGNTRFNKDNVLDIQIKNHTVENLAKVEFDMAKVITLVTAGDKDVQEGSYRIALYLGLSMGSQDSFYANDFVYKGKPLYVEFPVYAADDAAAIAKRVVKIANKYMLFMAQEKLLNVSADGGKVVIEAVNGYQLIKKAIVQKYDPNAKQIDCCNNNGDFIDILMGVPVTRLWMQTVFVIQLTMKQLLNQDLKHLEIIIGWYTILDCLLLLTLISGLLPSQKCLQLVENILSSSLESVLKEMVLQEKQLVKELHLLLPTFSMYQTREIMLLQ